MARFHITVKNTGDVALRNVIVVDPRAPAVQPPLPDARRRASKSYSCTVENVTAGFVNVVDVTASPLGAGGSRRGRPHAPG